MASSSSVDSKNLKLQKRNATGLLGNVTCMYRGPERAYCQAHGTGIKEYGIRIATCKTPQNYEIII
jgi:hypothetical protein